MLGGRYYPMGVFTPVYPIVKQMQHGLFREEVKIPGPPVLDAWDYFLLSIPP